MKSPHKFVFNINDRVKVNELNINGKINAIFISINEINYRVRFIYNNDIKEWYFSDDELELVNDKEKTVGFKTV